MKASFDRGDIVSVSLDPALGHEQQGSRPGLVLTTSAFNRLGDVLVAPITQGLVLINKIRMLDLSARKARRIERAPAAVIEEALARLATLVDEGL